MFQRLREIGYQIAATNHAEAIVAHDFPEEIAELCGALEDFRISAQDLIASGGGEAGSTQRLRRDLAAKGWHKHNFIQRATIDGIEREAISHEIDHVRRGRNGTIALEIEWNNKDPFFDRDLENFQRLHALSAISFGVVVTRGASLQDGMTDLVIAGLAAEGVDSEDGLAVFDIKERTARQREIVARVMASGLGYRAAFAKAFVADKFGTASTHWDKLQDRVRRGVGNPCPLILIGIGVERVTFDEPARQIDQGWLWPEDEA
ncbi:BglII/BstYI family type II restriction endonuclease [Marinovum algicola]|mgnify:FL=1|uniref:BglII/BstYI family type II restriction endonuclease n=1 Tax=Marinovum algicola TaxID=42444 RepID=UPI0024BBBD6E|nr:BglII/BstYI family type II restriction endonuclease [Marinovum algicola]